MLLPPRILHIEVFCRVIFWSKHSCINILKPAKTQWQPLAILFLGLFDLQISNYSRSPNHHLMIIDLPIIKQWHLSKIDQFVVMDISLWKKWASKCCPYCHHNIDIRKKDLVYKSTVSAKCGMFHWRSFLWLSFWGPITCIKSNEIRTWPEFNRLCFIITMTS